MPPSPMGPPAKIAVSAAKDLRGTVGEHEQEHRGKTDGVGVGGTERSARTPTPRWRRPRRALCESVSACRGEGGRGSGCQVGGAMRRVWEALGVGRRLARLVSRPASHLLLEVPKLCWRPQRLRTAAWSQQLQGLCKALWGRRVATNGEHR